VDVETASVLTTTAGRVLDVSEPRVGSRSTHQTSPRAAPTSLIREEISSSVAFSILDVILARTRRRCGTAAPLTR
jgi:hypothetical protein